MAIVETVDAVESGLEELGVPVPAPVDDPAARLRAWKSCLMSTDFSCSYADFIVSLALIDCIEELSFEMTTLLSAYFYRNFGH